MAVKRPVDHGDDDHGEKRKAHWAQIESQVKAGETFEVLNRGKVAAPIVPATPLHEEGSAEVH